MDDGITAMLRELEWRLTLSYVRKSPAELSELLADEFREFGSSGRVFDKAHIIDELQGQPEMEFEMKDFRATQLSEDWVLVSYRGTVRVACREGLHHSLRSSLWRRRAGRWQVVFHQGTKSEAA